MAGDLGAESTNDRQHSAWPEEQDTRTRTPLWKWLPSVLPFGSKQEAEPATPSDSEPVASDPAPPPPKRQPRKQVSEPEPEPEPKLTRKEQEAVDQWWKETGDAAVSAFSRCLTEHVVDETSSGSQSSYPEFVTTAMNGRCSREFAAMAQLILDRHGEDNFARIARKLIATKFVPAVKQVVEGGPPEAIPPDASKPALQAEMRQSKEAMLGCLMDEADRLAAASPAPPEQVADGVIAACQTRADAFFGKLEQLYPGATGGKAGFAAILDASYRPAIVQRIAGARDATMIGRSGGGKADADAAALALPPAATQDAPVAKQDAPVAISPAGEPAPGSPVPASSRP